mmetsp:Transcript_46993/g.119880  ORF Transcript_46993/g.119880 Transcript_46993/m.119880 type:complete len:228 (+) Transcript_46993:454-1137(+)
MSDRSIASMPISRSLALISSSEGMFSSPPLSPMASAIPGGAPAAAAAPIMEGSIPMLRSVAIRSASDGMFFASTPIARSLALTAGSAASGGISAPVPPAEPPPFSASASAAYFMVSSMSSPWRVAATGMSSRKSSSSVGSTSPQPDTYTAFLVSPDALPSVSSTRSVRMLSPSIALPNTVCFPLRCGCGRNRMKNCEPLVLGPALAIDRTPPASCLSAKFSSSKTSP